jgi:hypothetical protein
MVIILRTKKLEKSLLEISRFNLSKDLSGLLNMHFGEVKICFIPTAPIHIVCYIRNFFNCLEVSKCVLIWNMIYIRVPIVCFKTYHHTSYIILLDYSRCVAWYINMVLILRTQRVEKSLQEISRFNLSTYFGGVLKIHFGEQKMRFLPTAPIHIVRQIRFFFYIFLFKMRFHLNYYLHSCSSYLFQKLSPPKFLSTYSTVVGYI